MSVIAAYAMPHPPLAIAGVGRGQEQQIASTLAALQEVGHRVAALDPDVVVIASPHATAYHDYVHLSPGQQASGDFANFGDPDDEITVAYDSSLVQAIALEAALAGIPAGTEGARSPDLDHGTMVPLAFLQAAGIRCPIVRMGLAGFSGLEHYRLGQCLNRACERLGRRAVFIASGDLSHKLAANGPYGFDPAGPRFDRQVYDALSTADFGALLSLDPSTVREAAQCGLNPLLIMVGTLDGRSVDAELLSYEGPFGVGYAVAAFTPGSYSPQRHFGEAHAAQEQAALAAVRSAEDPWAHLARATLEHWLRYHEQLALPKDLPAELLHSQAGAFCSLHEHGELRGCVGTTGPTQPNLALEIQANVVAAATRDPRFAPVTPDELPGLIYSVDVLGTPEPVADLNELDPVRWGVIVSTDDGRRGLLLPDLEGVNTPEEQLAIARRKGGIEPHEDVRIERFAVVRHR